MGSANDFRVVAAALVALGAAACHDGEAPGNTQAAQVIGGGGAPPCGPGTAGAAAVTLTQGATDTTIKSATPTTTYGNTDLCSVASAPETACLLRWDASAIAPTSTVTSASLWLFVNGSNNGPGTLKVHRARKRWSEFGATWNKYTSVSAWQVPGAKGATDRDPSPLAAFGAPAGGNPVQVSLNAAGVQMVQEWVAGNDVNAGLMIVNDGSIGVDFRSSEHEPCSGPRLIVGFSP
jgi:hypothetical protein